jgi:phage gpG-like protein
MKITENNKVEIQKLADQAVEKALEICGIKAEGYAANLCPVDTGLLRNSIVSAVGGKEPSKKKYVADRAQSKYASKKKGSKSKKEKKSGEYTGQIAPDTGTPYVVVGTNVEYARKIELSDKEFLRPAIEDHIGEYNDVLKKELENG